MAYVSVLLPAFYFDTTDKNEIAKAVSVQFDTTQETFELYDITSKDNHINYAVKFKHSELSLGSIEELIYQRNCIKSICEKTFESLQVMTSKLFDVEKEIKVYSAKKDDETHLIDDNIKLKALLANHIEVAEKFRRKTVKTFLYIKETSQAIMQEFDVMKKKAAKSKPETQRESRMKSSDKAMIHYNNNNLINNIHESNNSKQKTESKGNGVPKLNLYK